MQQEINIEGTLKVWWIPQVPMKAFERIVSSTYEGKVILETLADYDIFQFENNIKPDYCNAGGLCIMEDGEWVDWESQGGENIDDMTLEELI